MSLSCRKRSPGSRAQLTLVSGANTGPTRVDCYGMADRHAPALEALFRAAGVQFELRAAQSGEGESHQHGFSVSAARHPRLQTLARSGIHLYPVRSLRGVVPAAIPSIATVVASVPPGADREAILNCAHLVSTAMQKWSTLTVVNRSDCQPYLSTELPGMVVQAATAPEAMTALVEQAPDFLIVPEELAPSFAAASVALTGTATLAFEVQAKGDSLLFTHRSPGGDVEPTALVFAFTWLLLLLGENAAAQRLHNAALRVLDDGLHTSALSLSNPYTRLLEPEALITATQDRLDKKPRQLAPVSYATRQTPPLNRSQLKRVL